MDGKWIYSEADSEIWSEGEFDTKEQAIEEGIKEALKNQEEPFCNDYFYVGQVEKVYPSGVDVDSILENVAENTAEGLEVGEDYLIDVDIEHQRELEEKLNEVLFAWMKKYGYEPNFFRIKNIEEVELK